MGRDKMTSGLHFFDTGQLQVLIDHLQQAGYTCIGPQVRDGAIVYDEINSIDQLPRGISDEQSPGHYSLKTNDSTQTCFGWANGPQAIKPLLFSPREQLWSSCRSDDGQLHFETPGIKPKKLAILGARACDIAALKLHDKHFLGGTIVDPYYRTRREQLLIIAVNCASPSDNCFCHSTGDGPFVDDGYDIALTELTTGFIAQTETTTGEKLLSRIELQPCSAKHFQQSDQIRQNASRQKRQLPQVDIRTSLFKQLDHNAWHDIASKCLSCGNCTSVCPTCFCHSEFDQPTLDGTSSLHLREWDSCFNQGHSYIHGITIRSQTSQRYRQWLTHKFSSWYEQYGRSGCVGCGRCITWCPVGIDVIESLECLLVNDPEPEHE